MGGVFHVCFCYHSMLFGYVYACVGTEFFDMNTSTLLIMYVLASALYIPLCNVSCN